MRFKRFSNNYLNDRKFLFLPFDTIHLHFDIYLNNLNESDLKVKRLLTERGTRHPQHLNTLLYASRSIGGRSLKQISSVYKETKIKAALRLATSNDSRLQAVAHFQQIKENKGRRSIFKDARRHAMEMALDLELGEDKPTLSNESLDLAECFNWSRRWRSAPTYTICAINEIIQQLVRTKMREELMGKNNEYILQALQPKS